MKIFLIGMPGSGKSTLGEGLAKSMSLMFIDLDKEIVNESGKSITDIFKEGGEPVFREIESELLRRISASNNSFVMSTGGGAPCYLDSMNFMNNSGITVYLKVSNAELEKRLMAEKDQRPLLAGSISLKQKINELITSRGNCYNRASIVIESDSITLMDFEKILFKS